VCDIVWGVGVCMRGRVKVQVLRVCDILWGVGV